MTLKDQRHFRRCSRRADITLKFRKKDFKAKMLNYSPDGIAVAIDNIAPVAKGDVVEIIAEDLDLRTYAEIIWSVIDKSILRCGLKNVGGLEGSTRDYALADVLIGLQRSDRTGVLTVGTGDIVKKVYIRNGDMIFAASNQDEDRLGDLLLREGKINKEQFDQSVLEMKRAGQRQGMALVRLGYLSPPELVGAVQHHAENIIESLFDLEGGKFEFQERPLPNEEVITLKLSAANLIYNGIKKITDINHIKTDLPSIENILDFSADPLDLFQDLKLDNSGKKIISRIDGKTSIKDIISITQLDSFEALKTICALISTGTIKLRKDHGPNISMPEEVAKGIIDEKRKIKADPKFREMIENMHSKCENLGHYGVLGIKNNASDVEVKAAYYKAAKKYHPDMHFHYADDSLKDKLSDIFSYAYEAYSILSDPGKRKEYDRMITVKPARLREGQDRAADAFEDGKRHLKEMNFEDAERLFGQATYYNAAISEYHYHYGLTLAAQYKFREAEKAFERARRLEPHNAKYLTELGLVYMELGYPARAKGLFEKALSIAPDNARAAGGLKKIAG